MEYSQVIQLDNLGGFKRGRLWYNHIPFKLDSAAEVINGSFHQPNFVAAAAFQFCCEIALLPREISNYGLLGVEFSPFKGDSVEYEIFYLEQPSEIFIENLGSKSDQVFIGMPKELAISVAEEMDRSRGLEIPNGKYSFVASAYGVVGSSKVVFSKLTSTLLLLARNIPNQVSIEKIKVLIADEIVKP